MPIFRVIRLSAGFDGSNTVAADVDTVIDILQLILTQSTFDITLKWSNLTPLTVAKNMRHAHQWRIDLQARVLEIVEAASGD